MSVDRQIIAKGMKKKTGGGMGKGIDNENIFVPVNSTRDVQRSVRLSRGTATVPCLERLLMCDSRVFCVQANANLAYEPGRNIK